MKNNKTIYTNRMHTLRILLVFFFFFNLYYFVYIFVLFEGVQRTLEELFCVI